MATGSVTVQNLYADILNQGSAGTGIAVNHNLVFPNGTGLDFNATQSTATGVTPSSSAVLDDYEEGTWTPVLRFGGATTGINYSSNEAKYTKIGNIVIAHCSFVLSNKGTATGVADVYGLPFNTNSTSNYRQASFCYNDRLSANGLQGYISNNSNYFILFEERTDGNNNSQLTNTNFNNTTFIQLTAIYEI